MRTARILGMAERGNYAGLAFVDPAADGGLLDRPAFAELMSAQRRHDLAGAQHACSGNRLNSFTLSLCMTILADLGDRDGSYAIAATLYPVWHAPAGEGPDQFWLEHPDGFDTALLTGPAAGAMRTDPRYLDLAGKLGLLAYWRTRHLPDFCTKAREPVCAKITRR